MFLGFLDYLGLGLWGIGYCLYVFFEWCVDMQRQEDDEMPLVPHSDSIVEGPQPMEGLCLSFVVKVEFGT